MVAEPLRQLGDGFKNLLSLSVSFCPCSGGRSSVGRAWDCDSQGRGFKPRRSPQNFLAAKNGFQRKSGSTRLMVELRKKPNRIKHSEAEAYSF